jgi:hypothetical protein
VEEIKAAEAREKERRLREFQLLRSEREKWEMQGAGASIARQVVEVAINRYRREDASSYAFKSQVFFVFVCFPVL